MNIIPKQDPIKFINKYRKQVPMRYNQVKLLDWLTDTDLDYYISISNRSDGKTYNYKKFFLDLAIVYDVRFFIIVRHFSVRTAPEEELMDIVLQNKKQYDAGKLEFIREFFYTKVMYDNKPVGIISDLNQATDLKNFTAVTKYYPLIIYDEFLALEDDYLDDEWEKLKIIYQNVDRRGHDLPIIGNPKVFLLGNAVNLNSPILAGLDIFSVINRTKIGEVRKFENICIELNKNEAANESRNLRAFREHDDPLTSGNFDYNQTFVAEDDVAELLKANSIKFNVKCNKMKFTVYYSEKMNKIMLSASKREKDMLFVDTIDDMDGENIYLDDKFFDTEQIRKHVKGRFLYDNTYTKTVFSSDSYLSSLNIRKMIFYYFSKHGKKQEEPVIYTLTDKQFIENTKRSIMQRMGMLDDAV